MLAELQQSIVETYGLTLQHDVRDFLITDAALAKGIAQGAMLDGSCETLLMTQDKDGLAMSLFLDESLLHRLASAGPLRNLLAGQLDDLWTVVEGISHFHCAAWKADNERTFSLGELELQGEIDKFVSSAQIALQQHDTELLHHLHGWLFDDVQYHPGLDDAQAQRYRFANDYAARYCRMLKDRISDVDALDELRRFYRLSMQDKVSHIHSLSWTSG